MEASYWHRSGLLESKSCFGLRQLLNRLLSESVRLHGDAVSHLERQILFLRFINSPTGRPTDVDRLFRRGSIHLGLVLSFDATVVHGLVTIRHILAEYVRIF